MGSVPNMIVGFIAFFLVLVRAISLELVQSDNSNLDKKGNNMDKAEKKTRIVVSTILESIWAIGVGIIVVQLST